MAKDTARSQTDTTVVVDDRQPSETVQLLLGLDIPARVERTEWGDASWSSPLGRVVVEEKTAEEMATSAMFGGGRADDQLRKCVENAELPVLMILGSLKDVYGNFTIPGSSVKIDFDRLDNWLLTWQLRGVVIKHCPQPEMRVYRLASLWHYTVKPEHRTEFVRQRKIPNLGKLGPRAEVLASLPGIGVKTASKLSGVHASLLDMMSWPEGAWTSYLGSRAKAKRVMALLLETP